jgi:hypothetical protein
MVKIYGSYGGLYVFKIIEYVWKRIFTDPLPATCSITCMVAWTGCALRRGMYLLLPPSEPERFYWDGKREVLYLNPPPPPSNGRRCRLVGRIHDRRSLRRCRNKFFLAFLPQAFGHPSQYIALFVPILKSWFWPELFSHSPLCIFLVNERQLSSNQ